MSITDVPADRSPTGISRKSLLMAIGGAAVANGNGQTSDNRANLLTVPIEVHGDWHAPPQSAALVLGRMREACLGGLALRSDRQPTTGLWVDEHSSGPPAVWLHSDPPQTAWVIVDVGERAWCQLAYQFGHELGHVFCNSWHPKDDPSPPCQWMEEALVETFSVRGLGRLAERWATDPPFTGDEHYAVDIRKYRNNIVIEYGSYAVKEGIPAGMAAWFRAQRAALDASNGLTEMAKALVPTLLSELERDQGMVEDYAALNRWPGRTKVPFEEYLRLWRASCAEIGTPGRLPVRLADLLGVIETEAHGSGG